MGEDALAVVDSELRVRGLEGLRAIDSSVFPSEPNGNLNAPTIMLAERAADMVRGRPLLPPSNAAVGQAPGLGVTQRSGTPVRAVGR
ncbi:MAG: GMC oxidoreductase [Albidovulum sp.]